MRIKDQDQPGLQGETLSQKKNRGDGEEGEGWEQGGEMTQTMYAHMNK
jgi:hypothetical protein